MEKLKLNVLRMSLFFAELNGDNNERQRIKVMRRLCVQSGKVKKNGRMEEWERAFLWRCKNTPKLSSRCEHVIEKKRNRGIFKINRLFRVRERLHHCSTW